MLCGAGGTRRGSRADRAGDVSTGRSEHRERLKRATSVRGPPGWGFGGTRRRSARAIYKRMFPLRSDFQMCFRLKQPVDEEYESVTSQFFTFPGLERRIVNGPRRHSNPPTG